MLPPNRLAQVEGLVAPSLARAISRFIGKDMTSHLASPEKRIIKGRPFHVFQMALLDFV
jgi:hypothetical protein